MVGGIRDEAPSGISENGVGDRDAGGGGVSAGLGVPEAVGLAGPPGFDFGAPLRQAGARSSKAALATHRRGPDFTGT